MAQTWGDAMVGGGFVDSFTGFIKDHWMMIGLLVLVAIFVIAALSMNKKALNKTAATTGTATATTGSTSSYAAEPWNAAPIPLEFGHGIKTRSYMTPVQAQRMLAKTMRD
jgi:hypothetical protein